MVLIVILLALLIFFHSTIMWELDNLICKKFQKKAQRSLEECYGPSMKIAWVVLYINLYIPLLISVYYNVPKKVLGMGMVVVVAALHLCVVQIVNIISPTSQRDKARKSLKALNASNENEFIGVPRQTWLFHWKAVDWFQENRPLWWMSFRGLTLLTSWFLALDLGPHLTRELLPIRSSTVPILNIFTSLNIIDTTLPLLKILWLLLLIRWSFSLDSVSNNQKIHTGKSVAKLCVQVVVSCFATYAGFAKVHKLAHPGVRDPVLRKADSLVSGYTSPMEEVFARAKRLQTINNWQNHEPMVQLGVVNAQGQVDPDTLSEVEASLKEDGRETLSTEIFKKFAPSDKAEKRLASYNEYHSWDLYCDEDPFVGLD